MRNAILLSTFLSIGSAALVGCAATVPTSPNVAVMPAPGKPFEVFQNDNAICMQFAREQIGANSQQGPSEVATGAVTGAVLGAAAGAALGDSSRAAGTGAGVGAVMGTAVGAGNADRSSAALQRRYDIAFEQCMYAKGNQLPQGYGRAPAPRYRVAPPPPPPY